MEDTSTEKTLDELRAMFARWGIPQQIVSDNGPQFTSDKFEQFVRDRVVKKQITQAETAWSGNRLHRQRQRGQETDYTGRDTNDREQRVQS